MVTQGPLETITDFALRVRYFGDELLKQPSPPWSPDYWKQVTKPRIVEMFLNGLQKSGKHIMGDFESPKTWDDVNKIVVRIEEMVFEYSKKTMTPSEKKLVDFATRLFYPDEYIDFENIENTVENTTSKVTYKEVLQTETTYTLKNVTVELKSPPTEKSKFHNVLQTETTYTSKNIIQKQRPAPRSLPDGIQTCRDKSGFWNFFKILFIFASLYFMFKVSADCIKLKKYLKYCENTDSTYHTPNKDKKWKTHKHNPNKIFQYNNSLIFVLHDQIKQGKSNPIPQIEYSLTNFYLFNSVRPTERPPRAPPWLKNLIGSTHFTTHWKK